MFGSFFSILSVVSSISQAFVSYQQAAAMKAYYDSQADITRLKYNQERAKAKEEGAQALKKANQTIATMVASAASGGVLTNEGSVMLGQTLSLRAAAEDYNTAAFNAQILNNFGIIEYNNLKQAGIIQQQAGMLGAIAGFGTDLTQTYQRTYTGVDTPVVNPNYSSLGKFAADMVKE
jgi:hypothetical protein